MRRRRASVLQWVVSLALLCALASATALPLGTPDPVDAQTFTQQATLTVISQPVEVQRSSGARDTASSGATMSVGDRVFTGPTGKATLTFFQGSEVEIGEGSEIMVQQMEQRGGAGGSSTVGIGQAIGSTVSRVASLFNPASRFQVTTPSAVAVVRGTVLQTSVDANKLQLFTCTDTLGTCDVTSGGQTQKLKQGESTFIFPPPPTPVALPGARTGGDQSGGQDTSFQDQKPATPIPSDQLQNAINTAVATSGATVVFVTLTPQPASGTGTPQAGVPSVTPTPGPGTPSATPASPVPSSTPTPIAPSPTATPEAPTATPTTAPPADTPQSDTVAPIATATATPTATSTHASFTATPAGTPTRAAMGVCTTNVSGTISISTTWDVTGSPYCLTGTVTLDPGVLLTITSYVDVRFNAGAKLLASSGAGNNARIMAADGDVPSEIRFMANTASPTAGYWAGIEVQDFCPANTEQRNYFGYVRIEHATTALTARDAMVQLSNGIVQNATTAYAGLSGECSNQDLVVNTATLNTTGPVITDQAGKLTLTGMAATTTDGQVISMTTSDLYVSGGSLNNSASATVAACVFATSGGSIYIDGTPLTCRGAGINGSTSAVTYRNATLSAAGGAGVATNNVLQVELATVTAATDAIYRVSGSGSVTITSSSLTSTGGYGLNAGGSGNVTVTDTQITAATYGINSNNVPVTFTGAAYTAPATPIARINAGHYGINTSAAAITVQNANITAGQYGVNINSSNGTNDIQITNAKLTQSGGGAGGYGVNLNGDGRHITLTDVIVDGFTGGGVNSNATVGDVSLTNTQVLSPGGRGVNIGNSPGTLSLSNSIVYRALDQGVRHGASSGSISLTGSTVSSRSETTAYGIYANNAIPVSLTNSTVRSVNSSGAETVGGSDGIYTPGSISMTASTVKLRGGKGADAGTTFSADAASAFTNNTGSGAAVPIDSIANFTPATYTGNGNTNIVELKGQLTSSASLSSAHVYGVRSSIQLGSGVELTVPIGSQGMIINGGGAVTSPSAATGVNNCTEAAAPSTISSSATWRPANSTPPARQRVTGTQVDSPATLTVRGLSSTMTPGTFYVHIQALGYFRTQSGGTISLQSDGGTVVLAGRDCI